VITQILLNGLISGSQYALVGVGFALVYFVTHAFHFAHGAILVVGAYGAYMAHALIGWGLIPAAIAGVMIAGGTGCLVDYGIYRPLRRRGSPAVVMLLASLGAYIFLQNAVSLGFGDNVRTLRQASTTVAGLEVLGARITESQLLGLTLSILVLGALMHLLRSTKLGRAVRAVAANPVLAEVSGIDSQRTILLVVALASALAGLAGVAVGLDIDISPAMGLRLLMMGVVAFVVGGTGSISGVAAGALFLGLLQHVGAWLLGSQWQDVIAFFLLLVVLVVRPSGLLGRRFSWR